MGKGSLISLSKLLAYILRHNPQKLNLLMDEGGFVDLKELGSAVSQIYPFQMKFPFDSLKKAEEIEEIVTKDSKRKYHRFRPAPYYGGIATADAVGCCFLCAYCWNYFRNLKPQTRGSFYSPQAVAKRLLGILRRKNFKYVRITGAEPVLGENSFNHFLEVGDLIFERNPKVTFILETNGFILGHREDFIKRINLPNLSIRIAIKGWDEESFQRITGAKKEFFIYPIRALKNLQDRGLDAWPAVMEDFFGRDELRRLKATMRSMGIRCRIETESLERYPYVLENMKRRHIDCLDRWKGKLGK